ncbi:hypothetical protein H5410_030958 [Solanum commersonii]|uniref:Uncharacterized protein n=1 Tax=Solanum commersonii TaxID=4109 RepID=A0A9J5YK89_SOLCO|nr:hypothetical protein H5410_030958 [Solanum commersonii]
MANEGDVNSASTTNVHPEGGKKNRKGKKHQKSSEEMLLDLTPSEALTSHPPSTIEATDDDCGEEPIDVTPGEIVAYEHVEPNHRHMISDESTELDIKVICGADEDNHKDSGNKCYAAESSDSFFSCSERESMTTNQDANNQEIETRKLLTVKLVREAIKRILLLEVQDHSYNQLATNSESNTLSDNGSIEIDEPGDSNDDSQRGASSNISNLGNDCDET